MDYNGFAQTMALNMVTSTTDANFQLALPNITNDAEQRLYRELDLLNTIFRDSSGTLTAGNRNFTLPASTNTFVVVDQLNVITPVSTSPDSGTRNPLTPASKEMLDVIWPSVSGSTVPVYFAMITQGTVIVGPWPDQGYTVEVVGTYRPLTLSASNQTTLLSTYFPDLLAAAGMVYATGYQRNFGAMSDDPKAGVSWESHLQELLKSAQTEEQRKKFNMAGWSSKQPAPQATPPRV